MNKIFLTFVAAIVAAASLTSCTDSPSATESVWPEKLVVAGVPQDQTVDASDTYALLTDLLAEELGIPVEFYEATDRAAIIEGIASERVDVAIIDSYGYVLSKQRTDNLEVIGVMARGADIEPGYYSLGVAKSEESSVNSISDAKGKTVCFSDPASTGGYLFPAKGLVEAGIDPKVETTQDINPVFAGTSASAGIAVVEGECELGFIVDTSLRFAESKGDIKPGALKTVWKSGLIPGVPLVVNKNLPSDLISEISSLVLKSANKTAFVESGVCEDEATCSYLIPSNWGFVKKDDSYFDPIRDVCAALGNKRCK